MQFVFHVQIQQIECGHSLRTRHRDHSFHSHYYLLSMKRIIYSLVLAVCVLCFLFPFDFYTHVETQHKSYTLSTLAFSPVWSRPDVITVVGQYASGGVNRRLGFGDADFMANTTIYRHVPFALLEGLFLTLFFVLIAYIATRLSRRMMNVNSSY